MSTQGTMTWRARGGFVRWLAAIAALLAILANGPSGSSGPSETTAMSGQLDTQGQESRRAAGTPTLPDADRAERWPGVAMLNAGGWLVLPEGWRPWTAATTCRAVGPRVLAVRCNQRPG